MDNHKNRTIKYQFAKLLEEKIRSLIFSFETIEN